MKAQGSGFLVFAALAAASTLAIADDPKASREAPQEYERAYVSPMEGEHGVIRPRSGKRIFAVRTEEGFYRHLEGPEAEDAAEVERSVKKKTGLVLEPGARVLAGVYYDHPEDREDVPKEKRTFFTLDAEVQIETGPNRGKVVRVRAEDLAVRAAFTMRPGTQGWLNNKFSPRRQQDDPVPVIQDVASYNAYLATFRDRVDSKDRAKLLKKNDTPMIQPGTKLKVVTVACSPDRRQEQKLDGPGIQVELLDGERKGLVGWILPELVARSRSEIPPEALRPSR